MRHGTVGRKLNRKPAHRRALFRNMATSLILEGRCETTYPKAKALQGVIEPLVTKARQNTLHSRRQVLSYVLDKTAAKELCDTIAPRYLARNGGYTRVVRTGYRHGDAAEMAVIEFIVE